MVYKSVVLSNGAIAVLSIYDNNRVYFQVYEDNNKAKYAVTYNPRNGKITVDGLRSSGYGFLKKPPKKAIRDYYSRIMYNLVNAVL